MTQIPIVRQILSDPDTGLLSYFSQQLQTQSFSHFKSQRLSNRFSLLLPKALLMWAIGVMSGVLVGNLARFQLEKFINRPKKHFSVTIFNNVATGGDRHPLSLLPLALLKGD